MGGKMGVNVGLDRESFLEENAKALAKSYADNRESINATYRSMTSSKDRGDMIDTLRKANAILSEVSPWMRADDRVDSITVSDCEGRTLTCKWPDYIASNRLNLIADWLSEISSPAGPVPDIALLDCAEALADEYIQNTGKPHWENVEKHVIEAFGLEEIRNDKPGDWIQRRLRDEKKRQERQRPQSNALHVVKERLAKTPGQSSEEKNGRAAFDEFHALLKLGSPSSKQKEALNWYLSRDGVNKHRSNWDSLNPSERNSWARLEVFKANSTFPS